MKRSSMVVALVAGTLCTVSMAQQQQRQTARRPDASVRTTKVEYRSAMKLNGVPVRAGGHTDALTSVYQCFPDPGGQITYSTSQPNAMIGDQGSFTPGPGAGGNLLITGIKFGLVVESTATGPQDYDIIVTFWDTEGATTLETQLAQFSTGFANPVNPGTAVVSADYLDLATLPGGGVKVPDDSFYVTMQAVENGTTTPALDGTFPFRIDGVFGAGSSLEWFYRDVSGDGKIDLPTERRGFAAPTLGNIVLDLRADVVTGPPPPPPPPPPGTGAIVGTAVGTAAPPTALGGCTLTKFPLDSRFTGTPVDVTTIPSPLGGNVTLTPAHSLRRIGQGWGTWSHGYTGDIYWNNGALTSKLDLPTNTRAILVYAEPNPFSVFTIKALASGMGGAEQTELSQDPDGNGGAKGYGFHSATVNIESITFSSTADFALGELAICNTVSPPPPPSCKANCNGDTDPVSGKPILNVLDFNCFQNAFALGDLAKADVGGTAGCTPDGALTISDFSCFQNLFALGCP